MSSPSTHLRRKPCVTRDALEVSVREACCRGRHPHVAQGREAAYTHDRRSGLLRGAQYRFLLCLELVLGEDPGVPKLSKAFEPPDEHVYRQQS